MAYSSSTMAVRTPHFMRAQYSGKDGKERIFLSSSLYGDSRQTSKRRRAKFGLGFQPPFDGPRYFKQTSIGQIIRAQRILAILGTLLPLGAIVILALPSPLANAIAWWLRLPVVVVLCSPVWIGSFYIRLCTMVYRRARKTYLRKITHRAAGLVLERYVEHGEPFVLYLRSFSFEGFQRGPIVTEMHPPAFEGELHAMLRDQGVPVLGVDNPCNVTLRDRNSIPKLCLPPDEWLGWLRDLIWASSLTIVFCDSYSQGILKELQLIAGLKRQSHTIIVLGRNRKSASGHTISSGTNPKGRTPSADDPIFQSFPYVVPEESLDHSPLADTPGFEALLPRIASWRRELQKRTAGRKVVFVDFVPMDLESWDIDNRDDWLRAACPMPGLVRHPQ